MLSGACPHAVLPEEPSSVLVIAFHLSRLQQAALCLPSWKQNLIQGHMSACHPSFPFRACAKVMRQAPRRSTMSTWRLSRVRFLPCWAQKIGRACEGKECGSTLRSRWSRYQYKKKRKNNKQE